MTLHDVENNLDEIFDLAPNQVLDSKGNIVASTEVVLESEILSKDSKVEDFELTRGNIKEIIGKGREALDGIMELAKASEHPRVYEVVGQLIKTLVDANKDLMALHKQNKELNKRDENDPEIKNVTNAIFVGSTAELQKIIRGKGSQLDE